MSGNLGRRLFSTFFNRVDAHVVNSEPSNLFNSFAKFYNTTSHARGFVRSGSIRNITSPIHNNARQISRRFASGGLLVLGTTHTSTATVESGAACAVSPEKIMYHSARSYVTGSSMQRAACNAWKRSVHSSSKDEKHKEATETNRSESSAEGLPSKASHNATKPNVESDASKAVHENKNIPPTGYNASLMNRLPQMHRPSKEELLAAATGFWSRLKVRFKWFSIRSVRPFTLDELSAIFSWVLLGHVLWIILGTTTFFSLIILFINTVFAQGRFPSGSTMKCAVLTVP